MATTKKSEVPEGYVELYVPRAMAGEESNEYISVNGFSCLIPKGQTSVVRDFIAEEYYRMQKAKDAQYHSSEDMIAASQRPL